MIHLTPSKRREIKHHAWATVAAAPRKSYLGRYRRLTKIQSMWIKSLLLTWGDMYGGNVDGKLSCRGGSGLWSQIMPEVWSDERAGEIVNVMAQLRKLGYRGEEQLQKAKEILWPKQSLKNMLLVAEINEECDFMERAVLAAMKANNPAYTLGKKYYAGRRTVTELGVYMQNHYAPWLTRKQAEDRVRWCLELFDSAVYCAVRAAICVENELNTCKIGNGGA